LGILIFIIQKKFFIDPIEKKLLINEQCLVYNKGGVKQEHGNSELGRSEIIPIDVNRETMIRETLTKNSRTPPLVNSQISAPPPLVKASDYKGLTGSKANSQISAHNIYRNPDEG